MARSGGTRGGGGISLYVVGTADVGLASAGYSARAQDASTVFTNPAGMTRLPGDQLTLGAQMLYADLGFSIGQGTSPALGSNDGGNPVGWFPGGGVFYSHSVSPDISVGLAIAGNFGSAVKYDAGWVGRYRAQEGTLLGVSILPSAAWRINENLSIGASLNAMYGKLENKVANLNFRAPTNWNGLAPGIRTLLASRGLLDANVDLGVTVPQGVNAGFYREIDPGFALLGSVGWQQWSKFGRLDVGIDSNNPVGITTALDFKDTWHVAAGAQYRLSDLWMLNCGIAYDSGFQDTTASPWRCPQTPRGGSVSGDRRRNRRPSTGDGASNTCMAEGCTRTSLAVCRWRWAGAATWSARSTT